MVYGPLCNGATSVLFESTPVYPDAGEDWGCTQGPPEGAGGKRSSQEGGVEVFALARLWSLWSCGIAAEFFALRGGLGLGVVSAVGSDKS